MDAVTDLLETFQGDLCQRINRCSSGEERREERQTNGLLDDGWNDTSQCPCVGGQCWIQIDFDQKDVEMFVDHQITSVETKTTDPSL